MYVHEYWMGNAGRRGRSVASVDSDSLKTVGEQDMCAKYNERETGRRLRAAKAVKCLYEEQTNDKGCRNGWMEAEVGA